TLVQTQKTKHLDIKSKWLRDLNNKNELVVPLIPSEDMVADTLTKSSSSKSLRRLQEQYFLVHFSSSSGGISKNLIDPLFSKLFLFILSFHLTPSPQNSHTHCGKKTLIFAFTVENC
ncbi:hypothetical protein VP01_12221g1, partial [Puccinia sorghi]